MQVNIQEGIIAEVHRFMTLDRETIQTVREALLSTTFTNLGLEEIYEAFLGGDYHGGVAAHQYQEIVLEHFFNEQPYEVKLVRIDAARRFLLQCLIAKDFLEEVFL